MAKQLTVKQQKFFDHYMEHGKSAEAYKHAYDTGTMNASTINTAAYKLLHTEIIQRCIDNARLSSQKYTGITLLSHVQKLVTIRDAALLDKKYAAAVQAEMAIGKVSGLYIDKIEIDTKISIIDALKEARERVQRHRNILEHQPDEPLTNHEVLENTGFNQEVTEIDA